MANDLMDYIERMTPNNAEGQIGDVFIKLLAGNENTAVRVIRVIMPIGFRHMVRLNVAISFGTESAIVNSVMFYEIGDKDAEREALDG